MVPVQFERNPIMSVPLTTANSAFRGAKARFLVAVSCCTTTGQPMREANRNSPSDPKIKSWHPDC
jgi:hypothetical protein